MLLNGSQIDKLVWKDIEHYLDLHRDEKIFCEFKIMNKWLINDKSQTDKERDEEKEEFVTDIISFLNSSGGALFIGIDNKGNLAGIPRKENFRSLSINEIKDEIGKKLLNVIKEKISPQIGIRHNVIENDDKTKFLIIFDIPEGNLKWYVAKNNKQAFVHFIRSESGKVTMDSNTIKYGYIDAEIMQNQITQIIKDNQITQDMLPWDDNKHYLTFFAIPLNFRSNFIHPTQNLKDDLYVIEGKYFSSEYEIDCVHYKSSGLLISRFSNGIIKIVIRLLSIDNLDQNVKSSEGIVFIKDQPYISIFQNIFRALKYSKCLCQEDIGYIFTINLHIENGWSNNNKIVGDYTRFSKTLGDLSEIIIPSMERYTYENYLIPFYPLESIWIQILILFGKIPK